MDRGLKAAFLFSVLVVAQAVRAPEAHEDTHGDRALSAHKPSTGALHAVAVLRSTPTTGGSLINEATPTAIGNYMITNGNGTWTYSYYSNNANLNGNDAGMGGDWVYPNTNIAWYNSNGASGSAVLAAFNLVTQAAPSSDGTGNPSAITQFEAPVSRYTLGINSLVFTGAKTGIAVGRYNGFSDFDPLNGVAASSTYILGTPKLNILLTYDGATTWTRATGVPQPTLAVLVATSGLVPGNGGTTSPFTVPPYPSMSTGDLTSVFMASKTLGWAVGGNDVGAALLVSSQATAGALGPAAGANQAAAAAATGVVPMGLVLMTQNGGSVWKYVPIWATYASLVPLVKNNDPSLKNIYSTPIPGVLFSVQSDASGKHVYAVGSPSSQYSTSATASVSITSNAPGVAITNVQVKTYGTILYSGNSGMSWVAQTAPTLFSGLNYYTLFSVAVQKGTTAVAVGGSAAVKFGAAAAGTIIYTTNGGFSWTQSVYPSSTGSKAPSFTCVALQPSMSGSSAQNVWVGGYTTRSDSVVGTSAAVGLGSADYFPVAAVTGYTYTPASPVNNPTVPASVVASGVPAGKGQIYTILISKDGGKTFAAAPTSGLPTGFVVTSFTAPSSLQTDRSVYGITWDNANHGWIYGYGYIMSTQNGGVTWVYETPADVGVTTVTPRVSVIATVPTSY